jgi:hypothetical protein
MVNAQTYGDAESMSSVDQGWNEAIASFRAWGTSECCSDDQRIASFEATVGAQI